MRRSKESLLQEEDDLWRPDEEARDWEFIILHHTATSRGSVESIHDAHLKNRDASGRPWLGIGYHFVIGNGDGMNDGEIEPTFRWRRQLPGAHAGNREHNSRGIGIVLVGNFATHPPTAKQVDSATRLVGVLSRRYTIKSDGILGHGDVRPTECPGRYFPLKAIQASVAALDDRGGLPLARIVPATWDSRKETLHK